MVERHYPTKQTCLWLRLPRGPKGSPLPVSSHRFIGMLIYWSVSVGRIDDGRLGEATAQGIKTFEPSEEAGKEWVDAVVRLAIGRRAFLSQSTPGYYNNEGGELNVRIARNNQYWRGPVQFVKIHDRWRKDGAMPGLERTW
jgi:hypothetical protein